MPDKASTYEMKLRSWQQDRTVLVECDNKPAVVLSADKARWQSGCSAVTVTSRQTSSADGRAVHYVHAPCYTETHQINTSTRAGSASPEIHHHHAVNFLIGITHYHTNTSVYCIIIIQYYSFKFCSIQNFESNSYFSIRFKTSTIIRNYWILTVNTYRHRFLTYLTEWRRFFTLATTPSNQQNLLLTMVQVLYLLEVFILAHYYGPPSNETPTTERNPNSAVP